jgi:hypothetical protein
MFTYECQEASTTAIKWTNFVPQSLPPSLSPSPLPACPEASAGFVRQKRWKKDSIYVPSLFNKRQHRLPPFLSNELDFLVMETPSLDETGSFTL